MSINAKVAPHTFEPALYSREELDFLLAHMRKPPIVALNKALPPGVNRTTVTPVLEEFYNLQQLKEHESVEWGFPLSDHTHDCGYEAIADSIIRYLAWMERVDLIRERSGRAIGNPSMFGWDSMGRAFKYGTESDSGIVRTEILDDGSRRPFGVRLLDRGRRAMQGLGDVAPWVSKAKAESPAKLDAIVENAEATKTHGTLTCSICGKVETFELSKPQAKRLAHSRMSRHLNIEQSELTRHRLLRQKQYESPTARL